MSLSKKSKSELSDKDILEITLAEGWAAFVAKTKKAFPKMPMKEIAAKFKKQGKSDEEMEQLSDSDIIGSIDKLTNILRNRKEYKVEETQEMKQAKVIKEMSEKIEQMDKALNAPAAKSVQELSDTGKKFSIYGKENERHDAGVLGMAEFLQKNFTQ